jgi:HK97 gp10 family phage protein
MGISLKFKTRTNLSTQMIMGQAREAVSQVVRKTALDIEADAKSRAPEDTGLLKNSIQASDMQPGDLVTQVIVGAQYGRHVEFGTKKMKAQPFLTPAVEVNRKAFKAAMNALVKRR